MLGAGTAAADTLVSNLGETTFSFALDLGGGDASQAFTTGSTADAYELTEVKVEFVTALSRTATVTAFIADGRGASDNIIATLTNPATWATTSTFTVPDGITLDANTTYHLIIEGTGGGLALTASNSEDSGGVTGWSIGDNVYERVMVSDSGLGGTWLDEISFSLKIAVEGDHKGTVVGCSAASMEDQVWTGTLTVGIVGGEVGYNGGSPPVGALDDTTFIFQETTYTVESIVTLTSGMLQQLTFELDELLANPDDAILHVGDDKFPFGSATLIQASNDSYTWLNTNLTWNQYDRVCLALTEVDTTAPVLMSATTTALELGLTYDEDLDASSEPAPSAFTVAVDGVSRAVTGVSVDETKVLLTLATAVRAGETVTVSYTVPMTSPLLDEASNPAAAFSDHPVTNEVPATAPEVPTGLEATPGDGSVTLRWMASAYDGGSEVTGHQYRDKTTGGFGSWQDIELSAPGEANATSYPVTSLANDTAYTFEVQARNAEGESGPSNQASVTPAAGDTTAPMLRSATTTALELGLTYDEDLDADSEPAPSAFMVAVNGASRGVTGVALDETKVLLTLATAVRAGETVSVSYTVPPTNPLRDEASNPAAAFADYPVTNEVPATVPDAPTGLEATPGDGSVTLRWMASAYDGGSEVTSHQYRHKTTGGFGDWEDIELSAPGEANATSFPVTSLANNTAYTFEVQARNAEGESGPSNQASATPVPGDSTAPVLRSATTTALELGLTYDENLDAGSEPAPSAFTVTVDGASRAVTGVSVDETKVRLTLAPAVRAGETVTVSYTVPMTSPLRDEARNPAAAFADHPVTNEVPATAPEAPTGLAATPGDESVTLRWTASAYDGGSEVTGHQYCREEGASASCTAESDWQDIAESAPGGANATGYTVTDLTNGTGYTFRVRARNAEGESAPSPEAGTTPDGADTASPELVRALSAGFGRMVGSQALRMVSAHLEGGGGTQVTVGGERLGGPATASLGRLEAAARDGDEGRPRTRTGREALLGSSFRLQSGGKETGAAAWGGMAAGRFETRSDGVATEGEVTTGMVGADVTSGRWLVGGALSHARGKGSFASAAERAEGEAEIRLTALHPYVRVRLGERLSAWGLAGYGKGELALSGADGERVATGLRMRMGAVGARGTVVPAPAGGGFELALKADALWMRVRSEAAEGLPGVRADARRLRLVLDASRVVKTAGGATLTPRLEAGVRRDGGDTERGTGLEVGSGLRYARSAVTVEGRVRALALHEASGYEEWGASGSVRVDPSASGRGFSLTLAPTWGDAASAVERLWSLRDAGGLAANAEFEPRARLDAELGYGVGASHGLGIMTPYAGFTLSGGAHRALRTGVRWNASQSAAVSLEASREGQGSGEAPTNALTLRAEARW